MHHHPFGFTFSIFLCYFSTLFFFPFRILTTIYYTCTNWAAYVGPTREYVQPSPCPPPYRRRGLFPFIPHAALQLSRKAQFSPGDRSARRCSGIARFGPRVCNNHGTDCHEVVDTRFVCSWRGARRRSFFYYWIDHIAICRGWLV